MAWKHYILYLTLLSNHLYEMNIKDDKKSFIVCIMM